MDTEGNVTDRTLWFVITDKAIKVMLDRVAAGSDPEMELIELYANCVKQPGTGEADDL